MARGQQGAPVFRDLRIPCQGPGDRFPLGELMQPGQAGGLGQHPAALLCEEAGGRVTNVTEAFVQYLASRQAPHLLIVEYCPQ